MITNSVDNDRIKRATTFAQEYDALMGLSMVPLGGGFILAAVTGYVAVCIGLGSAFAILVIAWYNRKYGAVRPKSGRNRAMVLGVVVAIVLIVTGWILDELLATPVSLSLLAIAISYGLGEWLMLRRIGFTPVHWVVCLLFLVAAFGPAIGIGSIGLFSAYTLACTGTALIVIGLVDHVRFVRLIGPTPAEPVVTAGAVTDE